MAVTGTSELDFPPSRSHPCHAEQMDNDETMLNRFFDGAFGRYVLPAVILQSVLIGGGYATGREIVSYGAKYGAFGWIGGIAIFLGFSLMSILTFEIARIFRVYDYRSLVKQFTWKLWILYDLIYVSMALLVVAVMASATGEIVQQTLGLSYWFGVVFAIVLVGLLNFYGRWLIERFKAYGTVALYSGYLIFTVYVVSNTWQHTREVLSVGDTSYITTPITLEIVLWTGILYVGYNLAVYPACLFALRRQTERKETVWGGIVSGILMTVPWFLTYFALMGFYPSDEILGATVPWLKMLEHMGNPWLITAFGVVVGWTLIETATGMIHALVERVNANLQEFHKAPFSPGQRALISVIFLLIATALARIGIIDLVARGYAIMGYGLIGVFGIPLATIGLFRIMKPEWKKEFWVQDKRLRV